MENTELKVGAEQLRNWLEQGKEVVVLDVRPKDQREEWQIPGSIFLDAYQRLNADDPSVLDEVALPKNVPVVSVCAAGKTSMIAAKELRKRGVDAYSLDGGMKAWSTAWNTATLQFAEMKIIQFRRTGKGCLSYMIISGREAIIVDASLPAEVYESILSKEGLSVKFTIDTHIHADHLSRSKTLADKFNVPFYLPAQDRVMFRFNPVNEDVPLSVGNVQVKSIHTPGHTLESTSYLIGDKVLLTGDTLFIDSIGRPDLKASAEEAKQKASLLYHSLHQLLKLKDDIIVLPGHTGKPVAFNNIPIQATLATIKKSLPILQLDEEDFVATIMERIPTTPANFLTIVEKNISGQYHDVNFTELEAGANRCAIS